jgi:hypothetical protein
MNYPDVKKLYVKVGRRYKPYMPNVEVPNNQIYFIEDGEIVPYNSDTMDWFSYKGRPVEGVWYCRKNGHSWIGDFGMSDFRIRLEKYREVVLTAIETALKNCDNKYLSRNDIASEILNELSKFEELEDQSNKN